MKEYHENDNFPYTLDENEWGEIVKFVEECPGVFYLATKLEDQDVCREIYAVTESAVPDVISLEALHCGKRAGQLALEENCVLPIYELLQLEDYHKLESFISSRKTLETQLYLHYTGYVIENNILEMSGHGKAA